MLNEILSVDELDINIELFRRKRFDFIFVFNGKEHAKQRQALDILTDNTTVELSYGGAAGGAKSWTGCAWLAFMCQVFPGTKWFIGRNELKRLRESTLITFFKVCNQYGLKRDIDFKYNGQDHYIQFDNGSRIDLLDLKYQPSDPLYERYGSVEYTGGWIEEAGEVHFGAYDTLKSRIGRHLNDKYGILRKLFITCNPKKNWVYTTFYKPFKEEVLPEFRKFLQALVNDNPHRESGYEAALQSISDKAKKQRLLFGNWEYDDDPLRLIEYEHIIDMWTNDYVEEGTKYITADIALQGSDRFVIGIWDGFRLMDVIAFDKCEATEVESTLKMYANLHGVQRSNIIYDSDGLGTFLRSYLKGAIPFQNGGKALNDENYYNLKTQCYYRLADAINKGLIYIDTNEFKDLIVEELEQIKRVETDDGKLRIIDKADMKEQLGRSPDFADMLMMRMYVQVKPQRGFSYRGNSK